MRENGARVTGEQAAAVLIREKRGRPSDSIRRLGSGRILVGRVAAREGREVLAGRGLLLLLGFLGRASARVGRARRKGRGPNLQYGLQSTVKKFYGFPFFRIFFSLIVC